MVNSLQSLPLSSEEKEDACLEIFLLLTAQKEDFPVVPSTFTSSHDRLITSWEKRFLSNLDVLVSPLIEMITATRDVHAYMWLLEKSKEKPEILPSLLPLVHSTFYRYNRANFPASFQHKRYTCKVLLAQEMDTPEKAKSVFVKFLFVYSPEEKLLQPYAKKMVKKMTEVLGHEGFFALMRRHGLFSTQKKLLEVAQSPFLPALLASEKMNHIFNGAKSDDIDDILEKAEKSPEECLKGGLAYVSVESSTFDHLTEGFRVLSQYPRIQHAIDLNVVPRFYEDVTEDAAQELNDLLIFEQKKKFLQEYMNTCLFRLSDFFSNKKVDSHMADMAFLFPWLSTIGRGKSGWPSFKIMEQAAISSSFLPWSDVSPSPETVAVFEQYAPPFLNGFINTLMGKKLFQNEGGFELEISHPRLKDFVSDFMHPSGKKLSLQEAESIALEMKAKGSALGLKSLVPEDPEEKSASARKIKI